MSVVEFDIAPSQQASTFKIVPAKKKLVESNKSISRNFSCSKSIFCYFKNDQKSIFQLAKSLKRPKMQFHEIDLFDFTSFFPWTFLNFLACCATTTTSTYLLFCPLLL